MAGLSSARKAAYDALEAARERGAYVRELIDADGDSNPAARLAPKDRAFALRLAVGVVSTYGTLDELIDRYASKPSRVDPDVRDALRLAAYEMCFLGKSPHVAVSQGVELVKTRAKSAAGFANAVLRRAGEAAGAFMAESDAHRFGMPEWLLGRVAADIGPERAASFGEAGLQQAPTYLANVPQWISDGRAAEAFAEAGVEASRCGAVPGAWLAADPAAAARSSLVRDDQAVVCDYGAQAVAFLAAPQPGDRVLEVGSGRGTKTILLAGHAHRQRGGARIWALDVHPFKARIAQERLERARVSGVEQVTGDARALGRPDGVPGLPPAFERVLVDAPCSGTGTLRRHPEITWALTPEEVASCAALQLDMLRAASARVAPGGTLVYATCSVLREEDEDVVAAFLGGPGGEAFEPVLPADAVPAGDVDAVDEMSDRATPEGFMRMFPAPGSCDGHFAAVLRRRA